MVDSSDTCRSWYYFYVTLPKLNYHSISRYIHKGNAGLRCGEATTLKQQALNCLPVQAVLSLGCAQQVRRIHNDSSLCAALRRAFGKLAQVDFHCSVPSLGVSQLQLQPGSNRQGMRFVRNQLHFLLFHLHLLRKIYTFGNFHCYTTYVGIRNINNIKDTVSQIASQPAQLRASQSSVCLSLFVAPELIW